MQIRRIMICLLIALLITPLIAAQETPRFVVQQNEPFTLREFCVNDDGTDCSASTNCNLTLVRPDGIIQLNNQPMEHHTTLMSYNLSGGDLSVLGEYPVKVMCKDSPASDSDQFLILVTPSGDNQQNNYFYMIIILVYGMFALGVWKGDITITMLGTFGLYFVGIWILFFGLDVFKNYLTNGFAIITLGVAGYMSIIMAHEYITG